VKHGGAGSRDRRIRIIFSDTYDPMNLPYWTQVGGPRSTDHTLITLDATDMRFATPQGFNSGEQFYTYL